MAFQFQQKSLGTTWKFPYWMSHRVLLPQNDKHLTNDNLPRNKDTTEINIPITPEKQHFCNIDFLFLTIFTTE